MKKTICMGWDSREPLAYDVARKSILARSSGKNTFILPLELEHLKPVLTRPVETKDGKLWCPISQAPMATEFAVSRFCLPFLMRHGLALFVDCDILCLEDIGNLFAEADPKYAVQVVKHDYIPAETVKMDGQTQTVYPRKNWSSVMLWNLDHPANRLFTKEMLNTWPGRDLHAFKWLTDDQIGDLSPRWNQLVDVNKTLTNDGIWHYTLGGPWLPDWKGGSQDAAWNTQRAASNL